MRARLRIQPGEPIAWTERVGWALASRAFPGKADRWVAAVRFPACTPLETPHRRMIWWKVSLFGGKYRYFSRPFGCIKAEIRSSGCCLLLMTALFSRFVPPLQKRISCSASHYTGKCKDGAVQVKAVRINSLVPTARLDRATKAESLHDRSCRGTFMSDNLSIILLQLRGISPSFHMYL